MIKMTLLTEDGYMVQITMPIELAMLEFPGVFAELMLNILFDEPPIWDDGLPPVEQIVAEVLSRPGPISPLPVEQIVREALEQ